MSVPYDASVIRTVIGGSVGSATSIISSSKSTTVAVFKLPTALNYSIVNTTLKIQLVYAPYGSQLSRCSRVVAGICLDNAAISSLLTLQPLTPKILDFYPETVKQGADSSDLLVYLTIGYAR